MTGKGIIGAIGTIAGKLSEVFMYGPKTAQTGYGPWAVDIEIIDPLGETARQRPTDYFKSLEDNDIVATTGMTKTEVIATLPAWAQPAFKNKAHLGFVGPLHQDQIIKLESHKLQNSTPREPNYSVAEIDFIVGGTGYEAPDTPEDFGPNFKPWVQAHKSELSTVGGWEGILNRYA